MAHAPQEQRGLELNDYSFAAAINIAANAKDPEVAQQLVSAPRTSVGVQQGATVTLLVVPAQAWL